MDRNFKRILEQLAIKDFLYEKNIPFSLIDYPDNDVNCSKKFPDCIVSTSENKKIWFEETSLFRKWERKTSQKSNKDYQELLYYSYSKSSDDYQVETIKNIKNCILLKKDKKNYEKIFNKYGKGILLISINDPFFKKTNLHNIVNQDNYKKLNLGYFESVYLYTTADIDKKISELKKTDCFAQQILQILQNESKFFLIAGRCVKKYD